MSEHNPDVAAVPCLRSTDDRWRCDGRAVISKEPAAYWHSECLTAAGYAVVRLPEGVEVTHGARLMPAPELYWSEVYVIDSTPAGACYCGPNGGPHWHEATP